MRSSDDGSAVVEFVLVSVLVVGLALALVQLALALYVRNTLTAAASEGARLAATADADPQVGVVLTRSLVTQTLPDRFAADVTAGVESVGGVPTVVVQVRAPLPLVGWFGPSGNLVVRGHAMRESWAVTG